MSDIDQHGTANNDIAYTEQKLSERTEDHDAGDTPAVLPQPHSPSTNEIPDVVKKNVHSSSSVRLSRLEAAPCGAYHRETLRMSSVSLLPGRQQLGWEFWHKAIRLFG